MTTADLTLFLDFDGVLHLLCEPAPHNDWTLEPIHGPKANAGPFFTPAALIGSAPRTPPFPNLVVEV